jgi:Smg protein
MNENIVELLLYLFENYIYENEQDELDKKSISKGLFQAGFASLTIQNAFSWIEELHKDVEIFHNIKLNPKGFRVLSEPERLKIDEECMDFILYLNNSGVFDAVQREILINAIMKLETNHIDVDDLHWLTLMVLFSQPEQGQAFAHLEALMFDTDEIYEH